jgi:hypothetical protein
VPVAGICHWVCVFVVAFVSVVFGAGTFPVVVGAAPVRAPVMAPVVDVAAAIAAAAIASGALAAPEVAGALARAVATGISATIGLGAVVVVSAGFAELFASAGWLPSAEVLSDDLLSLVFELLDLLLLPCDVSLLPLLLSVGGALPVSLLLTDELAAWSGGLRSAEELDDVRLGGFLSAAELSLAERGGGGAGCCGAGGSRFWGLEGRLLSTSAAKWLESCEGSGRAGLGGAF